MDVMAIDRLVLHLLVQQMVGPASWDKKVITMAWFEPQVKVDPCCA